jgi:hypothetical protein
MKINRCKKTQARAKKKLHKIHNKGMAQKYADLVKRRKPK